MSLHPYAPEIDAARVHHLPKTDLHVHAETHGRLMRVIERRRGLARYDHGPAVLRMMGEVAPGLPRLLALNLALREHAAESTGKQLMELYDQPDYVEACFEELMEEEASNGCRLAEIRCGGGWPFFPHFVSSFRSAEGRVQRRYPAFHAEPIVAWALDTSVSMDIVARYTCALASEGIAGVDLYPEYRRFDYSTIYRLAEMAAEAGLGVTCHDGEFDPETLWQALEIPGLTRLGHATQAYKVPGLLDEIARRGIVVEVALTSNVVLGAVESYETHPLRRFLDAGVRVTLCSDDPLTFGTDIGREYAIASMLGFSNAELLAFARTGIESSFTTPERKADLLAALKDDQARVI